jgi:hypothetical protein
MCCIAEATARGTCVAALPGLTTTAAAHDVDVWRERIRAEYLEMPGLHLTVRQAQRLWGLDELTCALVLAALEHEKFLRRTSAETYART